MLSPKKTALTFFVSISLLIGCATQAAQSVAQPHSESWLGTWGASATVPVPNSQGFNNQTLRLIAHVTLGGDEVRIRIANTFGTSALVIGATSIALQDSGATVIAESNRSLTFGGSASISIPPGALVVSDAVNLTVPAQHNLAVSIFVSSDSGPATVHPLAMQTSYVSSAGNFIARADTAPFVTTLQSWPFLSGIEVRNNHHAHTIVAFGDSITDGYKSTVDANHRWPDYFFARLLAADRHVAVVNEGISGNRIWHDATAALPIFGPNALSRFARDALDVSGASHIVVLLGINDIGMGSASRNPQEQVSADEIIVGLKQFATRAHAHGLKIVGATLTPFDHAAYASEEGEQKRLAVNAWLRTAKEFDGVIDFDAAVRDPHNPSQFLAAYDSGDHLHPNDAGYKSMAESIKLSLFD